MKLRRMPLWLIALLAVGAYLAYRKFAAASAGAGDRTELGPVTGDATPYWDYGSSYY